MCVVIDKATIIHSMQASGDGAQVIQAVHSVPCAQCEERVGMCCVQAVSKSPTAHMKLTVHSPACKFVGLLLVAFLKSPQVVLSDPCYNLQFKKL